mmetsp:Transcript_3273/g.4203  ORF Transcript_3273/g.4203 Transcript_3273/m.4203 type:complete len:91 (-) Transcript_3273:388-660(-)
MNVTMGLERRRPGKKYFLRISAQNTRIKMNMLKRHRDPKLSRSSAQKEAIHFGYSLSNAMTAAGVYEGWTMKEGTRNQMARRVDVKRIRL